MRSTVVLSLVGLCLSIGAALVGCGDDVTVAGPPSVVKSQLGESCGRTDDCDEDLSCINQFCAEGPSTGEGGRGGPAPAGPVLSEEGESCTKTADCAASLSCIQLTCVSGGSGGGEGGAPPVAKLGGIGEACETAADCSGELICIPGTFTNVCDLPSVGLEPTGQTCGAECIEADDCCELPTALGNILGVTSCEDVLNIYLGGDKTLCEAPAAGLEETGCFYYQTYCECAATTWACTDRQCVYNADCSVVGTDVLGGCPTYNRISGFLPNTTCDLDTEKCGLSSLYACTTTASCVGQYEYPSTTICEKGECVCFDKLCKRACDENADCAAGRTCDTKTKLCILADCTSDQQCASDNGDVRSACVEGACTLPCSSDYECNLGGTTGGSFGDQVCNADGVCEALGCAANTECPGIGPSFDQLSFCSDAPSAAPPPESAITD